MQRMPLSGAAYDPDTLAMLYRACAALHRAVPDVQRLGRCFAAVDPAKAGTCPDPSLRERGTRPRAACDNCCPELPARWLSRIVEPASPNLVRISRFLSSSGMDLKAGRCSLIVNGTAFADFSCVIELLDNAEPQGFGFLSGPVDQLK